MPRRAAGCGTATAAVASKPSTTRARSPPGCLPLAGFLSHHMHPLLWVTLWQSSSSPDETAPRLTTKGLFDVMVALRRGEHERQLIAAVANRDLIIQGKSIVMKHVDVDAAHSFALIIRLPRGQNIKLHEIPHEITSGTLTVAAEAVVLCAASEDVPHWGAAQARSARSSAAAWWRTSASVASRRQ